MQNNVSPKHSRRPTNYTVFNNELLNFLQ